MSNHATSHAFGAGDPIKSVTGTTTNDNAAAGEVGQYVSSTIVLGSAVGLTTSTPADITSISLTAGDWDVDASLWFGGNGATTVDYFRGSISATSATLDDTPDRFSSTVKSGATVFGVANENISVGTTRFSLASTTTIYMVADTSFGVSTCSGYGTLRARRMR